MEYLHELAVLTYWQLFIIHLNDHEVKSRIMLFKPALHRPVSPIASSHVLTQISFNSVFSHRAKAGPSAAHVSTLNRLEL